MTDESFKDSKAIILGIMTVDSFAEYNKKFGEERTLGYLDAMEQMLNEIDNMFSYYIGENCFGSTPNRVKTSLQKYHTEKVAFLVGLKKQFQPG